MVSSNLLTDYIVSTHRRATVVCAPRKPVIVKFDLGKNQKVDRSSFFIFSCEKPQKVNLHTHKIYYVALRCHQSFIYFCRGKRSKVT